MPPQRRARRDYDVVALSVPIVYTLDGDHDPNGMMFALARHADMLEWLDERWHEHDDHLPDLHHRRHLVQLVVDGLDRYERMLTSPPTAFT